MASLVTTRRPAWRNICVVLHACNVFPRYFDVLWNAVLLHILTELRRPPISVRYRCYVARLLVLLGQLAQRIQRQLVLCRLASRVVASRSVLEINLLEEIVQKIANMWGNRFLIQLLYLDLRGVDRAFRVLDHRLKHIRGGKVVPRSRSVAMVLGQKVVALSSRSATLRYQQRLICPFST